MYLTQQTLSSAKKFLGICVFTVLMVGCRGNAQLPTNAHIAISPSEKTWNIVQNLQVDELGNPYCEIDPDYYQDEFIAVSVEDSQNRRIGDAQLLISLNLAGNTYSGRSVLELYDDRDGNFLPSPQELVTGLGDNGVYVTATDEYSGTSHFIVRMNLSCTYRGELTVSSEGYTATAVFQTKE